MLLAEPSRPAVYLHPYPTLHGITYVGMRMVNNQSTPAYRPHILLGLLH